MKIGDLVILAGTSKLGVITGDYDSPKKLWVVHWQLDGVRLCNEKNMKVLK